MIDPAGHTDSVVYSATGLHNTVTTISQSRVTTYRYDRYGQMDTVTLPSGSMFTAVLDSLGRTRQSKGPNGTRTTYAYDSVSNLRSVTDAEGQIYQYSRNALGWVIAQINADTNDALSTRTDSFFYNAAGLVTKHRDRNAAVTTFVYDSLGRPITRTLADGRVTHYGYDPKGLFQADSSSESIDTVSQDTAGLVLTEFTQQAGRGYKSVSTSDWSSPRSGVSRGVRLRAVGLRWRCSFGVPR